MMPPYLSAIFQHGKRSEKNRKTFPAAGSSEYSGCLLDQFTSSEIT
jgi:hypothetical protein